MPVIGLSIKSINANRNADIEGGVKVSNATKLKDVREQDLPALGKKGLAVEFEFKAGYEAEKTKKGFAEIVIGGDVILIEPKQEDLLKAWKKDKKLPDDLNIVIINTVLRRCLTESLVISEKLSLPPPLALPFASAKKPEESRYIG